jgi:hypothetical protein
MATLATSSAAESSFDAPGTPVGNTTIESTSMECDDEEAEPSPIVFDTTEGVDPDNNDDEVHTTDGSDDGSDDDSDELADVDEGDISDGIDEDDIENDDGEDIGEDSSNVNSGDDSDTYSAGQPLSDTEAVIVLMGCNQEEIDYSAATVVVTCDVVIDDKNTAVLVFAIDTIHRWFIAAPDTEHTYMEIGPTKILQLLLHVEQITDHDAQCPRILQLMLLASRSESFMHLMDPQEKITMPMTIDGRCVNVPVEDIAWPKYEDITAFKNPDGIMLVRLNGKLVIVKLKKPTVKPVCEVINTASARNLVASFYHANNNTSKWSSAAYAHVLTTDLTNCVEQHCVKFVQRVFASMSDDVATNPALVVLKGLELVTSRKPKIAEDINSASRKLVDLLEVPKNPPRQKLKTMPMSPHHSTTPHERLAELARRQIDSAAAILSVRSKKGSGDSMSVESPTKKKKLKRKRRAPSSNLTLGHKRRMSPTADTLHVDKIASTVVEPTTVASDDQRVTTEPKTIRPSEPKKLDFGNEPIELTSPVVPTRPTLGMPPNQEPIHAACRHPGVSTLEPEVLPDAHGSTNDNSNDEALPHTPGLMVEISTDNPIAVIKWLTKTALIHNVYNAGEKHIIDTNGTKYCRDMNDSTRSGAYATIIAEMSVEPFRRLRMYKPDDSTTITCSASLLDDVASKTRGYAPNVKIRCVLKGHSKGGSATFGSELFILSRIYGFEKDFGDIDAEGFYLSGGDIPLNAMLTLIERIEELK